MIWKLSQMRFSVRLMFALLLLATTAFVVLSVELSLIPLSSWSDGFPAPVCDVAFLAALFSACGLVGWMYAADLDIALPSLRS